MTTLEDREFVERMRQWVDDCQPILKDDAKRDFRRMTDLAMRGVELEGWAAKRNPVAGDPHEVLSAEVNLLRADAERLREALRVAVEALEALSIYNDDDNAIVNAALAQIKATEGGE